MKNDEDDASLDRHGLIVVFTLVALWVLAAVAIWQS